MRPLTLLLSLLALLALACTSETDPSFSDVHNTADVHGTSQPTEPDTYNSSCFFDCFGEPPTCKNGVITAYHDFLANCDTPGIPKSCDYEAYKCKEGCRSGISYPGNYKPSVSNIPVDILCVESTPTAGSSCSKDFECLLVENREALPPVIDHLRCEERQCISILPLPPADYLQPCGLPETQTAQSFAEASACSGGVCIVHYDDNASLSACEHSLQGCTQFCLSDLECPLGSLCVSAGQLAGDERSVCKPGALSQWSNLGLSNTCE